MCEPKPKKCKAIGCNNEFTPSYTSLQKYCSSQCTYDMHKRAQEGKLKKPRKRIKQISKKRAQAIPVYKELRKEFLQIPDNKNCIIKGPTCTGVANTIEHTKGREGYADEWARNRGITLYIDARFFKPACLNCNLELERNPELSQEHQLSKIHNGKKI